MNLTEKWPVSCFDSESSLRKGFTKDKDCIAAKKALDGNFTRVNKNILHAVKLFNSRMQRDILEALLLAEDCSMEEIDTLTGVSIDVIRMYSKLFFRIEDVFISKIDLLDYIESGISLYGDSGPDYSMELESFLVKRWVASLGKEFVVWRYRLKPVAYAPASLYSTILKEAFFYHKEKSMGNDDISMTEYLRSTNALLGSVRASTSIKEASGEDAGLDMLEHLDIIIQDVDAPTLTLEEIQKGEFVNNALEQENT